MERRFSLKTKRNELNIIVKSGEEFLKIVLKQRLLTLKDFEIQILNILFILFAIKLQLILYN